MDTKNIEVFQGAGGGLVKAWTVGVPFEDEAREQVKRAAAMPFVHKWVAIMPTSTAASVRQSEASSPRWVRSSRRPSVSISAAE